MTHDIPSANSITLATEQPGLESFARAYCAAIFPDLPMESMPLDAFTEALQGSGDPESLMVVAVRADADGHLANDSMLLDHLLASRVPVLVLRQSEGAITEPHAFARVVVPLDGSPVAGQAIPVASRIARRYHLPVKFVMVIDPSRVIPPAYAYDPEAWGVIEELRLTSHWALGQAEDTMKQDGVEVSSDLLLGSINASLMASIHPGDLVVMTTHGLERIHLRYRESVARRVLVSTPEPILIMQADRDAAESMESYQACGWVEPLKRDPVQSA
jgi:nucleotide-binding universal stress UspA family protein